MSGLTLHAAVRVEAHDRKRLEPLCRYITRPALSDESRQDNGADASSKPSRTASIGHPCVIRASHRLPEAV